MIKKVGDKTITLAETAGFCFGVKRAIDMAMESAPAVSLGPLIHNETAVARLEEEGIRVIGDLDEAGGLPVIIRSHGAGRSVYDAAKEKGIEMHVGNLLCHDAFYNEGGMAESLEWAKMGTLAVEMESTALYLEAARAGKRGLTICTISDHLVTGEATTSEERQNTFTQMMEIALETAILMEGK